MRESIRLCLHITRRNWRVYRKDFIANTSPTLADPALIMLSLGLGLGGYLTNVEGMAYLHFLAPGLTVATALFTSFFESSWGFYIRKTYEHIFTAMLTTPIGASEIVIGELFWVGLKGAGLGGGVGIVLAACGLMTNPWLLPLVPVVCFLVALGCGAIGLIATTFVRNMNQFQSVYSFIIAPLYFLSGIFFPIAQLHPVVRVIADCFPLIHGVRLAQAIFWNRGLLDTALTSGSMLLIQCLLLSWIALVRIRKQLIT